MRKKIDKKTLLFTHPVFIVGAYDANGKPNIMAASWGGICCSEPPCVTISLREATYTFGCIMESGAYSINIPSRKFIEAADYAGTVSGRKTDKFKDFGLTPARCGSVNAPYVAEFPMHLECKVVRTINLGLHTQFIGEIIEVAADEETLDKRGMPDLEKIDPIMYDTASAWYYSAGPKIMKAYTVRKPK